MPPEGWFRRKSKVTQTTAAANAAAVPEGVATKCAKCGQILFTREFEKNLKVCPHCDHHHRLTAEERIAYTLDEGSFAPLHDHLTSTDPLEFPEYRQKLDKLSASTGLNDGIVIGTARIQDIPVVAGVSDFRFIMASMGSVAGEKIVRAIEEAIARRLPVVLFTVSGGARMHEGLLSLMQMAKTSAAVARLAAAGLPYIVVMSDPTLAGVLASYASLGDILIAEPGAMIGLAGARVTANASVQKPPADYQTAEWQLKHGHIDQVVARRDLPETLGALLRLLGCPRKSAGSARNGQHANGAIPALAAGGGE